MSITSESQTISLRGEAQVRLSYIDQSADVRELIGQSVRALSIPSSQYFVATGTTSGRWRRADREGYGDGS